jgi:ATP-dependent Clp protease ATP-binding subunit ClpA
VLELSLQEALQLGHTHIDAEHLLLGLIREGGVGAQVLVKLGADRARVREQVLRLLAEGTPAPHPEHGLPADRADLDRYDQQLAKVRWAKQAAIDAQDFDTAAVLRMAEKHLLHKRAQRKRPWAAGADIDAVAEENRRLHQQVEHLRDLLRQHGIEPDAGTSQTA